jgi:exosortase J
LGPEVYSARNPDCTEILIEEEPDQLSVYSDSKIGVSVVGSRWLSPVQFAALATTLAVLGLSTIWFTMETLWNSWTTDALKSVGMFIPVVSLILILRAWRSQGWSAEGTWWGLPLLLISIAAVQLQQRAVLIFVISPQWSTGLPPPSLVLLAYGSAMVLLFGGVRLFRAALFPILLLWFANPVPHAFSLLVDLPLQHASASTARAFAIHLGHTLTPDHLRLMFTPEFGMFIAPGCNGIRGSVTMGFIALITGYLYRFRWYANVAVVAGAILLGYVFNLLRLCLLVLYYIVAMHFTSLQDKTENADYVIGAILFLVATLLLFAVIHRLRDKQNPHTPDEPVAVDVANLKERAPRFQYARLTVVGLIVLTGCVALVRGNASVTRSAEADLATNRFPQRIGNYTQVRTWNETMTGGPIVYVWAEYSAPGRPTPIAIGISPMMAWHDPLICHTVRGEHPLWQGQLTFATAGVAGIDFGSSFYNDGVTQYLEASTPCRGASCGEFATERTHFGFIYSHPDAKSLIGNDSRQPVRVLLRAESMDMSMPADVARQRLTQDLRDFLAIVRIEDLTTSASSR